MRASSNREHVDVLLVEDNLGDIRLTEEIFKQCAMLHRLSIARDGEEAMACLRREGRDAETPLPSLIVLDLNLPKKHGREVLAEVKADPALRRIPIVVLTTSSADRDINECYDLHVNSHSPQVPIVVLTGFKDDRVAAQTLRAGGQDFLNKSAINYCKLHQTLRHAMERKQADRSDEAKRAVEEANRAHDRFLAALSGELRKPLTSLLSTVAALTNVPTTAADLSPPLAMIRFHVEQQARLLDDILAYSRIGTKGATLQPTDCEAVVERAIANLKSSIDETGAVVTQAPLPSIGADADQMVQLFQNLIANAIRYRGEAPPLIHVMAERQGEEWVFSIGDHGIGFDRNHAERIFTIFQHLNSHDKYPGTGIGLAICKKIVERHSGRIWAESEQWKGSRFFFTIPARANGKP